MHRFKLADIRKEWDAGVSDQVKRLGNKLGMDWRPEDVYAQCYAGHAFLWLCDDGFMVVKITQNQFDLEKELFVWICCSSSENGITDYMEDIKIFAKEYQCKRISFESPRSGFHRLARQNNWKEMTRFTFSV